MDLTSWLLSSSLCIALVALVAIAYLVYQTLSIRIRRDVSETFSREINECKLHVSKLEAENSFYKTQQDSLLKEIENLQRSLIQETELRSRFAEKATRTDELEAQLVTKQEDMDKLCRERESLLCQVTEFKARIDEEIRKSEEKQELLQRVEAKFLESFKALSSDALKENQKSFLDLAKATFDQTKQAIVGDVSHRQQAIGELVKPLKESLDKVDQKIQDLEKVRVSAYSGLTEQLKSLSSVQMQLQAETTNLAKALRMPTVRGRWGEIQLKRVVEMAGMLEHCDFVQQASFTNEDTRIRPDLIVNLPNSRQIVIDAKAPLQAYLEGIECNDDSLRQLKMKEHAKHLRKHLSQLSDKAYWGQLSSTPEFVVLFLPGDVFFNAALEHDPSLIEYGVDNKVLLATPTTLIALLRAVAYGWRQQAIAEHAEQIHQVGKTLYERLLTLVDHFSKIKKGLEGAVDSYNKAVGCLESRVLVSARRFKELNVVAQDNIPILDTIEKHVRFPQPSESGEVVSGALTSENTWDGSRED